MSCLFFCSSEKEARWFVHLSGLQHHPQLKAGLPDRSAIVKPTKMKDVEQSVEFWHCFLNGLLQAGVHLPTPEISHPVNCSFGDPEVFGPPGSSILGQSIRSRVLITKNCKTVPVQLTKKIHFLCQKWPPWRTTMQKEKPSALKREHPTLKKWNFFTVVFFVGYLLTSWTRIRIQPTKINADPDPNIACRWPIIQEYGKVTKIIRLPVHICFDLIFKWKNIKKFYVTKAHKFLYAPAPPPPQYGPWNLPRGLLYIKPPMHLWFIQPCA
jgi:hypothetical protein